MCGGDYVKVWMHVCVHCTSSYLTPSCVAQNGRRGHSSTLFPSPAELKYSCNDARTWIKRVGVATFALPVAGVALSLALPAYVYMRSDVEYSFD